ncbi:MAG TPA: type II toxin-antitoxin system PemK/MazF family toxin [Verrucomicrobiae bacterium]
MKPGDLYWVEFPGGAGRAQAGRRPAIVVQGASASAKLPTVLLVPLTTQLDALRFPGTFLVESDSQNGLRLPSVALVFQMTAIDKRFLAHNFGRLSETDLQTVWSVFGEITAQ